MREIGMDEEEFFGIMSEDTEWIQGVELEYDDYEELDSLEYTTDW